MTAPRERKRRDEAADASPDYGYVLRAGLLRGGVRMNGVLLMCGF